MTGLVRKALTIAAGLAVVASVAYAGIPSPQNSSVEAVIVGNARGFPLGAGGSIGTQAVGDGFVVTVRDINNTPLGGKTVVLDFSATVCKLHGPAPYANITVNCGAKTLSATTNVGAPIGQVIFAPKFGGSENNNLVEVSCDGVVLANVKARSTDCNNGVGDGATTGLTDYSYFTAGLAAVLPRPELNFDLSVSEIPGLPDYTILVTEIAASVVGAYCP